MSLIDRRSQVGDSSGGSHAAQILSRAAALEGHGSQLGACGAEHGNAVARRRQIETGAGTLGVQVENAPVAHDPCRAQRSVDHYGEGSGSVIRRAAATDERACSSGGEGKDEKHTRCEERQVP
jgi:hypothetical protein